MKFPIYLIAGNLFSNSQKAVTLQKTKKLGEFEKGRVIYSNYEALHLIESNKAQLIYKEKPVSLNKTLKLLSKKHKNFSINYIVFKDLRKKGYIIKTGLKFGAEFRAYKKNEKHARYLVFPATRKTKLNWNEIISKTRISHSTAKKLLIAIVDSQQDISYYELDWVKI